MDEYEDELTLVLRKPLVIGDVTYESLNLREPTAGELSKANKQSDSVDIMIALISMVAKVPKTAVEQMVQRDLEEAADFLGHFSGDSQKTSET